MAKALDRVVFDTNVLVSAVVFGGSPAQLLKLARSGDIIGVTSAYILGELRYVLRRPGFGLGRKLADDLALGAAALMECVPISEPRASWSNDPKDDLIVETALVGQAGSIVTGDRHLLQAQVPGIEILTVAAALARLTRTP